MEFAAKPGSMSPERNRKHKVRTGTQQRDDSNAIQRKGAVSKGRSIPHRRGRPERCRTRMGAVNVSGK